MAMGKLSSLGLGSTVLNYDVINKLRKSDEQAVIAPIDKKMEKNVEKQKELLEISSLLGSMKSSTSKLSDYSTYIGRGVNIVGDAVKATAAPGVPTQDINLEIRSIAKNDINEIGSRYSSRDDKFSKEAATLDFYSNGNRYRVDITPDMTLGDVAQAITDASSGNVVGVVMKTGGQKPFQLMINSKDTGEDNKVYFGSILRSERLDSNPVSLAGEDDFYIDFQDDLGYLHRVSLVVDSDESLSLQQKAELLRKAIKDAASDVPGVKEMLDNGDVNVGLAEEGRAIVLNDRRGFPIVVGGNKASELGFPTHNLSSKVTDMYESTVDAKGGRLSGVISIGSVPIDLSLITEDSNTSYDNAQAIVNAIENISGIHANRVQGRIFLNSEVGRLTVTGVDDEGKKALKDLGLKPGALKDYSHFQSDVLRLKNIQSGSDAEFTFNGAMVKRGSNHVSDVIGGLDLTLLSVTEPGKPNVISITNDIDAIKDSVKDFVKNYNESVAKLDASTRYDPESRRGGVFNTESIIREIRPNINQAFLSNVGVGVDVKSLVNYGMTLDDKSVMTLDENKLVSEIKANPDDAKKLFYGHEKKDLHGRYTKVEGVFPKINKVLVDLLDSTKGRLKSFGQTLDREVRNLTDEKDRSSKLLDSRYDTMASRFAAYDEQISKANNSFNAVQMMIDQAINAKKR